MAEKTSAESTQEPTAATAKNPMAEMCERFMAKWASGCGPKAFSPSACCSGPETTPTETKCGEPAAEGEASS